MTVAVPLFPPAVAVIVVEPAATPLTTPDEETVAVEVEALCHVVVTVVQLTPVTSTVNGCGCAVDSRRKRGI